MKKHTIVLLSIFSILAVVTSLSVSSCKKSNNGGGGSSSDSGTFYFHLHTNVDDTTIGGNPGPDSSSWEYVYDNSGARVFLTVPQFFLSGIKLHNVNGTFYSISNAVLLKGLDSEDLYLARIPIGTYDYVMFNVGLPAATNSLPPTSLFITDGNYAPLESSMWTGATSTGYYGMVIQGLYDTTATHTGASPVSFNFQVSNSLLQGASTATVTMPQRLVGFPFPPYILTGGSTQYIHILCDYAKLLQHFDLKTANNTMANPALADTIVYYLPSMFRYEE